MRSPHLIRALRLGATVLRNRRKRVTARSQNTRRPVATLGPSPASLNVVIANAGYGLEGTFEETPLAEVRRQFEVNVFATMATLQAALPHMRRRRRGHLLAVTSMGGLMAVPGMSAYCGSKFALKGVLESLGKEVASSGST